MHYLLYCISKSSTLSVEERQRWSHLRDLEFPVLKNGEVTILIGSDLPEAHWVFEKRRGRAKEPLADRTLLGWRWWVQLVTSDVKRRTLILSGLEKKNFRPT